MAKGPKLTRSQCGVSRLQETFRLVNIGPNLGKSLIASISEYSERASSHRETSVDSPDSLQRTLLILQWFRGCSQHPPVPVKDTLRSALTLPASWIDLSIAFIARCVLISSNHFFMAAPKRFASSLHESIILAFVSRAL